MSVAGAVEVARSAGWIGTARVAVMAHRCTDATAELALSTLRGVPGVEAFVESSPDDMTVGRVRALAVERAARSWSPAGSPRDCWIFSTDADSVVPSDWIVGLLRAATSRGAAAVAGLVHLEDWVGPPAARAEYERIVTAGMNGEGHRHVYAANLAIRMDVYWEVGGFPSLPHGEEHGLVAAVRAAGRKVATPLEPRVITSGRMPGRASQGLGALLQRLDARAREVGAGFRSSAGVADACDG